jgi:hypothetical protein
MCADIFKLSFSYKLIFYCDILFFTGGLFKLTKKESQDVISLRELLDLLNSRDHQKVIHSNGYGK